ARYLFDWSGLKSAGNIFALNGGPFSNILQHGWIFWSLKERYSAGIAFAVILLYLALYALFLQPYLGDAARYFRASPGNVLVRREIRRQAVEMLDTLHKWGTYDRIVVVAHSLGTVVGYDMLRAYFSRVNNRLPRSDLLEPEFSQLDQHDPENPSRRDREPSRILRERTRPDRKNRGRNHQQSDPRQSKAPDLAGHGFRHAGQSADPRVLFDV